MNTYLTILVGSLLVNNFVMNKFLGICPFLGVSKKFDTALGMGMAVTFVMTLASFVAWIVEHFLLVPFNLMYMRTIAFILVIAVLVQVVEMALKKMSPSLYQSLGVYLPLITTNCAVLGVALLNVQEGYDLLESLVYGFSGGIGFIVAIYLFSAVRQRVEESECPQSFRGFPLALVAAGLLALAFMGFSGMKFF